MDAIQVIDEIDLHQLPDSVNREILKNSREIVYEEDPNQNGLSREESFLTMKSLSGKKNYEILEASRPAAPGKKHFIRYNPHSEDEKKSLYGSRRNLSSKNLAQEDDKRSLNGSRRNLNGSRRLPAMSDKTESLHGSTRNLNIGSRENLIRSRRHTGSKELLATVKRSAAVAKTSKGLKDANASRARRKQAEKSSSVQKYDVEIDIESPVKKNSPPNLEQVVMANYLSPSELSPESGIVDSSVLSSPEMLRKDLKLPASSVIAKNRRSYEHAQLQDVNETMTRPSSGSSSSDSDSSMKANIPLVFLPGKTKVNLEKQNISYTSV